MTTKLEKYYNYVVDDLVNNTNIDYDNGRIIAPFLYPPNMNFHKEFYFNLFSHPSFKPHVISMYGIKEDEVKDLWERYKLSIYTLIKK